MEAGRELDCLIAEKVFGYIKQEYVCSTGDYFVKGTKITRWYLPTDTKISIAAKIDDSQIEDFHLCGPRHIPNYSTNLNDTWLLVNWMIQEKNIHFHLDWIVSDNEWVAGGGWIEDAKTPEMAICKIALKIAEVQ